MEIFLSDCKPKLEESATAEQSFHLLKIVKSNRLVEASYHLTLVEQQIILYAMCLVRENQRGLFPDDAITIRARHFSELFGGDLGSVYGQLKEGLNKLYNRSLTLDDYWDDKLKCWCHNNEVRWISAKSYLDGAGAIRLIFSPEIIKQITKLDANFTSYKMSQVSKISSASSIRLYELLIQHKNLKRRYFEVSELKHILYLKDKYPDIGDFRKRVIDVACEHINSHSDMTVSYHAVKNGKSIKGFEFEMTSSPI